MVLYLIWVAWKLPTEAQINVTYIVHFSVGPIGSNTSEKEAPYEAVQHQYPPYMLPCGGWAWVIT